MPFSIELAYENPKYKSLNTKDKSKKLKVKGRDSVPPGREIITCMRCSVGRVGGA